MIEPIIGGGLVAGGLALTLLVGIRMLKRSRREMKERLEAERRSIQKSEQRKPNISMAEMKARYPEQPAPVAQPKNETSKTVERLRQRDMETERREAERSALRRRLEEEEEERRRRRNDDDIGFQYQQNNMRGHTQPAYDPGICSPARSSDHDSGSKACSSGWHGSDSSSSPSSSDSSSSPSSFD